MKKTYIIPQTEVFNVIGQAPLLQGSDPKLNIDSTQSTNADAVDVKSQSSSSSIWDDDWND